MCWEIRPLEEPAFNSYSTAKRLASARDNQAFSSAGWKEQVFDDSSQSGPGQGEGSPSLDSRQWDELYNMLVEDTGNQLQSWPLGGPQPKRGVRFKCHTGALQDTTLCKTSHTRQSHA